MNLYFRVPLTDKIKDDQGRLYVFLYGLTEKRVLLFSAKNYKCSSVD